MTNSRQRPLDSAISAIDMALASSACPIPSQMRGIYNDFQLQNFRGTLLRVNLLAQLAYFLYGFADLLIVPDMGIISIGARSVLAVVTVPIALLVLKRSRSMAIIDITLPVLIILATIIWFVILVNSNQAAVSTYKYASIIFIVLGTLCVQHAFLPALVTSLVIAGSTIVGAFMLERHNEGQFLIFMLVYFPVLFFCIVLAWNTTVSRRRAFLQHMKEQYLGQQYSRFAAMISHEFRNPLGIIDSQVSLLRRESDTTDPLKNKRLNTISKASQRISTLFDRWLHQDRIGNRLHEVKSEDIDLTAWLPVLLRECEHLLEHHQIRIQVDASASLLRTDRILLETMVTNLLDNAVKYSDRGTEIVIATHRDANAIGLSIRDQGRGIAQEQQLEIFDAYVRLNSDSGPSGLGLGLALTKKIITTLGGRIEVESTPKIGTTFSLWFQD